MATPGLSTIPLIGANQTFVAKLQSWCVRPLKKRVKNNSISPLAVWVGQTRVAIIDVTPLLGAASAIPSWE